MILVTLEGLDKSCDELLKRVQISLKSHILPWPNTPIATSAQSTRHDVTVCMSGVLAKMRCLHRTKALTGSDDSGRVVCGAHWIDLPKTADVTVKKLVYDTMLDLSRHLADTLDVHVAQHVLVFVRASEHEIFERLLESMESRDVLLSDLESTQQFLDDMYRGNMLPTMFPHAVAAIEYPPYANDNQLEIAITASKIVRAIQLITQKKTSCTSNPSASTA
jgi:hypothetical protein